MAKKFIDKIERPEGYVVADKTSLKALRFIKNESGWTVVAKKELKDMIDIKIPTEYKHQPVTAIGKYAFKDCEGLMSVVIPDTVNLIDEESFYNCKSLTNVTIPKSVVKIGDSAFYYCSNLKTVTFLEDSLLELIGAWAFYDCKHLININLEVASKLRFINNSAFFHCIGLRNITIPEMVGAIASTAFFRCNNLNDVKFLCTKLWTAKGEIIPEEDFSKPSLIAMYLREAYFCADWISMLPR
jgi:hypothetical protein